MQLLRSWSAPLFSHMQKTFFLMTRLICLPAPSVYNCTDYMRSHVVSSRSYSLLPSILYRNMASPPATNIARIWSRQSTHHRQASLGKTGSAAKLWERTCRRGLLGITEGHPWVKSCVMLSSQTPENARIYIWASLWENRSSGFPTRSHTNLTVQPQKKARGLKFCI